MSKHSCAKRQFEIYLKTSGIKMVSSNAMPGAEPPEDGMIWHSPSPGATLSSKVENQQKQLRTEAVDKQKIGHRFKTTTPKTSQGDVTPVFNRLLKGNRIFEKQEKRWNSLLWKNVPFGWI
jgi:hypothetical protein